MVQIHALVRCEGEGTRLRPLTYRCCKAMVPLGPATALTFLLERLDDMPRSLDLTIAANERDVGLIRSAPYVRSSANVETFGRPTYADVLAMVRRMTTGALSKAPVLCIPGDNYFEFDLNKMVECSEGISRSLVAVNCQQESGLMAIDFDEAQRVTSYVESMSRNVATGIVLIHPADFGLVEAFGESGDCGGLVEFLASEKTIDAFPFSEYWADIGSGRPFLETSIRTLSASETPHGGYRLLADSRNDCTYASRTARISSSYTRHCVIGSDVDLTNCSLEECYVAPGVELRNVSASGALIDRPDCPSVGSTTCRRQ